MSDQERVGGTPHGCNSHDACGERERILGELHDCVMLPLVAARMFDELSGIVPSCECHPKPEHRLACRNEIDEAIRATSRLMRGESALRVGGRDVDAALRDELGSILNGRPVVSEVDVYTGDVALSLPEAQVFVRATREMVVNAAKHADASCIAVQAWQAERCLISRVVDDGCGFEHALAADGSCCDGRLGLAFASRELQRVGGTLLIRSAPKRGTSVIVKVPMPSAQVLGGPAG